VNIKACAIEDESSRFVRIDTELYNEFEIIGKKQGGDDTVEFINHVLKPEIS
jgi:hypothetical protein